jgi:hypothetical protein
MLVRFEPKLNLLHRFSKKNLKISNFMKIRPMETKLFRANRQPDTTKLIVNFRNFAKASKNLSSSLPANIRVSVKVGTGANALPTPLWPLDRHCNHTRAARGEAADLPR